MLWEVCAKSKSGETPGDESNALISVHGAHKWWQYHVNGLLKLVGGRSAHFDLVYYICDWCGYFSSLFLYTICRESAFKHKKNMNCAAQPWARAKDQSDPWVERYLNKPWPNSGHVRDPAKLGFCCISRTPPGGIYNQAVRSGAICLHLVFMLLLFSFYCRSTVQLPKFEVNQ